VEIQSDRRSQGSHHPAREVDTEFLVPSPRQRPRRVILLEFAPADARAGKERAEWREPKRRGDRARARDDVIRMSVAAAMQHRTKKAVQRHAAQADRVPTLRWMERRPRQSPGGIHTLSPNQEEHEEGQDANDGLIQDALDPNSEPIHMTSEERGGISPSIPVPTSAPAPPQGLAAVAGVVSSQEVCTLRVFTRNPSLASRHGALPEACRP